MDDKIKSLREPFDPQEVSFRVGATTKDGKGLALAYIDARNVMDRLDDVVGPENWQAEHVCADNKTTCRIGIKLNNEWIWKSDGAGDTNVEAEKGAISDSFKRSAVHWGIGRYLYNLDSGFVNLKNGRLEPATIKKLRDRLPKPNGVLNKEISLEEAFDDLKDWHKWENWATEQIKAINMCHTKKDLKKWKEEAGVKYGICKKHNEKAASRVAQSLKERQSVFNN